MKNHSTNQTNREILPVRVGIDGSPFFSDSQLVRVVNLNRRRLVSLSGVCSYDLLQMVFQFTANLKREYKYTVGGETNFDRTTAF